MAEQRAVYSSKINKIRSFALILVFAGILIMYIGLFTRNIAWLTALLFILGILSIILSTVVYLWIGTLSLKAVPVICPDCGKQTKMLGRVDACMYCKQPLTMDKELEGEEFDERYNKRSYKRENNEI
ncbi:YgzB family protein [Virgibacillus sp. NKC19-16]|uniref:YgzB family protein n=1 Tax=Virgibacillus salidurans TaxID=2831673 RepID=UPI001F308662|nr:YgzB family protein [Virgibacillus sp. NKC19-16]UJL47325.1 YgzB family protein [Virgibacillus sp. NKC19-16]